MQSFGSGRVQCYKILMGLPIAFSNEGNKPGVVCESGPASNSNVLVHLGFPKYVLRSCNDRFINR